MKLLWDQLKEFISTKTLSISSLMPQSAIRDHICLSNNYKLINYLLTMYVGKDLSVLRNGDLFLKA